MDPRKTDAREAKPELETLTDAELAGVTGGVGRPEVDEVHSKEFTDVWSEAV